MHPALAATVGCLLATLVIFLASDPLRSLIERRGLTADVKLWTTLLMGLFEVATVGCLIWFWAS
ncbi:MAG: hypothetical protein AB7S38_11290 [Vulcanimicrobiota bacterium]